ncbi:hypothetical protein NRB56_76460 [Nocardia sp. RB56]|uniref:Uncharacterized protein n=1 Tax=Nocardia aurantia TaxID=2585199 RepID=A0A7K0E1S0_9NOCA|nr:hypothetical protein [Nocardia aurantia]
MPDRSNRTGKIEVNQPTVRDRSAPGTASSSRPCPSNRISTESSTAAPSSEPRPEAAPSARHFATASASAVSRPSLTPPWNSPGTVVSSARVTSADTSTRCFAIVPVTSTAGSKARVVSNGSGPSTTARHRSSSPARSTAARCNACAQVRMLVATGGSVAGRPAAICPHAATKSGTRIRHDTPSTTRWCAATSSRPARSVPGSRSPADGCNQTNRITTPASGSSPPTAASNAAEAISVRPASSTLASNTTRSSSASTSTVPGAAVSTIHSAPACRRNRARSMSWRSTTAARVATIPARSIPTGSSSARD